MTSRYFSQRPIQGERHALSGDEAHHAKRVMRIAVDDEVVLFDGRGAEFDAQVTGVTRQEVEFVIVRRREVNREVAGRLTLAVALPKGDRQRWLVEKAVELGVARIVPIETARSVARPTASAVARLERAVVEATKQCGRNRLTEIADPVLWSELAAADQTAARFLAHPGAPGACFPGDACEEAIVGIGPEGGFTDEEIAQGIAHGWQPIDLGPRILRVETAALAVAALWANRAG